MPLLVNVSHPCCHSGLAARLCCILVSITQLSLPEACTCSIPDSCRGGLENLQCNGIVVAVIVTSDAVHVTVKHCLTSEPAAQMSPSIPPFDEYEARRCCRGPHDAFKWMLKMQTAPEDTAAIIIEPILGEGGFVAPPPDFLSTLRKHCDEHNIVMIIDEVKKLVPSYTVMCSRMKIWYL